MGERRDQGGHPPAVSLWFSSLNGHDSSCHGGLLHSALSLESSPAPSPVAFSGKGMMTSPSNL